MKKKTLSLFLVVLTILSVLPTSVLAACSHSYEYIYTIENERMHSYKSECTRCGTITDGWGYAGWENHSRDRYGVCEECGHCDHSCSETVYSYENSNMHSYYTYCDGCGKDLQGSGYAGWEDHSFDGNTCEDCGFEKACRHYDSEVVYSEYSSSRHEVAMECMDCGIIYNTETESHSWEYWDWESVSATRHSREKECICGEYATETESHSFSGNICEECGYRKEDEPAVSASVRLYAESDTGSLGEAGGEIASEYVPAEYTVYAEAEDCEVTRISYIQDGTRYTVYGDSVTITADSESEFTTTTFTAYTDVDGVTATFTVNHKFVRKNVSYYMWATSHEATIRSITGNGINKSLAHTMTIPNSYDDQTNLTDEQVAEIQELIGRSDGQTYMVNYTRIITVYTPAELSYNGEEIIQGVFDGYYPDEIEDCLTQWDWNGQSAEAIRQAASSSLSFTTGLPVECTAVWIDTTTGEELYSIDFGEGSVTPSNSVVVSVSYSDYPYADEYLYESLSYRGNSSGTSTARSYSQTYTANSDPLTVTFYCHPPVTNGSITVRAVDGDTMELIDDAGISCGDETVYDNPYTFADIDLGTYTVSAWADGYTDAGTTVSITSTANEKNVTLKLYREVGDITVTVKDSETREPIYRAEVEGAERYETTDRDGMAYFEGILFGSYTFEASADGYYPNSAKVSISSSNVSNSVTIYLDPIPEVGEITVRVKDSETNRVIVGALVEGAGERAVTGSDGTVTFCDVPFDRYTFEASADGYYSNEGVAEISLDNMEDSITIYLDPIPTSGDITVRVVDSVTERVISGAAVEGAGERKITGSGGTVTFYDVPFDRYTFEASADGYYSNEGVTEISLEEMTADLTIYLDPIPTNGDITVYVKDKDTGAAIAGATVSGIGKSAVTNNSGVAVFADLNFGTHTFTASADGYEPGSENASISETRTEATVTIYLEKLKTDLSPDAFCNGEVYKGSTIMVSAEITNDGDVDLTPSNPATVVMTAKRNGSAVFATQSKTVIIPANDTNLVWFAVEMPRDGYTSDTVTFEFTVSAPSGVTETDLSNNSDSVSKTVSDLPARACADSGFTTDVPSAFTNTPYTRTECGTLTWEVYEWNGGFVKKTYTAVLDTSAKLIPNVNAGYRVENSGVWTTRSGYGVDTEVTVDVESTSTALAGTPKVDSFYPEHNYSTAGNKSDRLELLGGKYVFQKNSTSVNDSRMHGVPLWFPDGTYAVKYYAYDVWCPMGMLTGYTNAYVKIDGDMYDDLYTN